MDGQKFDKLTRAFAAGTDRRSLLKIFGGATLAGVAGVSVVRPSGVFAQSLGPGDECTSGTECASGLCSATTGGTGVCYCENPDEPVLGCPCSTGTEDPCYGTSAVCCANEVSATAGADGTCVSGSTGCDPTGECSDPGESCESSDDCCVGDCGANGFCTACYSGTESPCGTLNEMFGADFICCTAAGAADGAVGYCTEEDLCVSETPNTGAGTTADTSNWIAPVAAVGAAAAVLAYKSRESKNEA